MAGEGDGRRRAVTGLAAAGVFCVAALVLSILVGRAAWRGWLGAAFLCIALPSGAIGMVMSMRLVPGAWAREGIPLLQAQARLLPFGAAAFLPVLIAVGTIYRWAGEPQSTAFRAVWLSEPFFIARTVIWLAVLGGLWLLLLRRTPSPAVSCVGLVLFLTLGTFAASDWLQSLDPDFNSSGFPLYVISLEMLTALALAIVLGLSSPAPLTRQGVLGGLLLTVLLFWGYLAYMPYFISWSADVPAAAVWYVKRGKGVWAALLALTAACRFIPMFMLLFSTVRNGRKWLLGVAAAVVFGSIPEVAWIVLPAAPRTAPADGWTAAVFVLAVAALASLALVLLGRAAAAMKDAPP